MAPGLIQVGAGHALSNATSIVNGDTYVRDMRRGFRALFYEQLEESRANWQPKIDLISMRVQSDNNESESHRWIGPPPKMTEHKGERRLSRLAAHGQVIENKHWANGLEIDGDDIRRDKLSQYSSRIRGLADQGIRHQYTLLGSLLNSGFSTGLGYDGAMFFNAAHVRGSTTWDNYLDSALSVSSYKDACTALMGSLDDEGDKLDLTPTHLIVGSDLYWTARDILQKETIIVGGTAETNTARGTAELVVLSNLTAGYWFVADLSHPAAKPLILQIEVAITPSEMTAPDAPNVFLHNKYYYGADWHGNAGYGLFELIVGSDGS